MSKEKIRKRSHSSDRSRTRHKHKLKNDSKRDRKRSHSRERNMRQEEQYQQRRENQYEAQKGDEYEALRRQRETVKLSVSQKVEIIKEKPCWEPSGILLKFYNSREGVSLKFHEPPQSRPPIDIWRMYIFKGQQVLQPILLSNSCYLVGKDQRICDILCENPSISRQHAVLQFRLTVKPLEEGGFQEIIKPYLMDLESTNGTTLNGQKVQSSRYIQLLHKDVLKFGFSEREYVIVKEEGSLRQIIDQK